MSGQIMPCLNLYTKVYVLQQIKENAGLKYTKTMKTTPRYEYCFFILVFVK